MTDNAKSRSAHMRRFRSILVTLIGISLVAGVASYVPEAEAKAYSRPAPATQQDESVVGHDLQVPPTDRPDPTAVAAQKETPRPIWPGASDATVTLPTPAKALAATPTPVSLQRVGDSPVSVSPAPADGKAKSSDAPSSVRVEVFDQQRTQELGVKGLALRLARTDGVASPGRLRVKVDYSSFRYAYGADWGSRLRLVQLQCSSEKTCERSTVVPNGANDGKAGTYTADVAVAEGVSAFALSAAPSGPYGSYAASTLAAASTWNVGKQTGDFTWSYPFRMPPGTAGPRPELSIGYSSGSVDGQTASTNNQPSWLGQGQSLEAGFVERKYVSCADDMGAGANNTTKTGDQCWKSNNATLSLGSHSSELLWDATQETWKLRKDDGSRIEHLTGAVNGDGGEDIAAGKGDGKGEYWRLTTADGTQYYFGLNPPAYATTPTNSVDTVPVFGNNSGEPCYKGGTAFATSYCQQAWRWNVDRVVDRSGNVMTYRYVKETNNYGRNNNTAVSTYDRASYLSSIEYGEKLGADTGVPPARVIFGVTERCLPSGTLTCAPAQLTAATATSWPDVPFDQICTSASTCPNQTSPAFFTRKRLYTLYTQVLTPDGTARTVDSWAFTQTFPDPGDSTAPALWLNSIQHTGMVGGQSTDPLVSFTKIAKPNRVAGFLAGGFPMNKYRVSSVKTESGAQISVNYSGAECTYTAVKDADPATNTRRCFPAYWTIEGGSSPTLHWFHKYVATQLVEDDLVTDAPDKVTTYTYSGDAAWHYDDNDLTQPKYRTWGDWRGYGTVYEQVGPVGLQTSTSTLYFRGMHGDRASASGGTKTVNVVDSAKTSYADFERLNGYVREEITYNGAGGVEVTGTINTPWLKQTATGDGHAATLLNTSFTRIRTRLADGSYRVAGVDTDFDTFGMPTAISDIGDVLKGDDDRCTRLTYVRNLDAGVGITDTVSREEKVAVSCDLTPNRPAQVISDERTYYDKHTDLAAKPTAGLVTKVETMTGWNGAAVYEQRTRMAYDTLGRTVETYDGLDRLTSSVEFVPATGGPVTQTKTTDAAGNVSVSTLEPAWGSPTVEVDPNGKRTDLAYDASGRLTGVWLADRPKSAGGIASVSFSYLLSNTAGQPNVVTTQELKPNGAYKTTQTLLDGLLRQRQVQTPGANGTGRLITDTKYGSRGVVANEGGPYYEATTAPTNKVYDVLEQNLPAQTVYTVDGVNRVTTAVFKTEGAERWRTLTSYGGNYVAVDPPAGATPTMTFSDIRGNTTELRQYQGADATGAYDSTTYTYTSDDQLATVKNAGNSVWTYTYDLRGRQISASDPDKGTTTSTYDDADRLASSKDARGQSLFYDYDVLDRKTAVHSGSTTGPVLTSWKYDSLGKGLLTSSTRVVDGNSYESAITGYDDLNRPTATQITIPASEGKLAGVYTSSTEFNPDGSVSKVKLPSVPGLPQETVQTIYDPAGNLQAVGGWTSYVVGAQYSSYGEPTRYTMGDVIGHKSTFQGFTYEPGTRRLTSMKVDRESQTTTDDAFNYTYDAAGNITALAHSQMQGASTDRQCFAYDYLRRMTEARTTSNASCATAPTTGTMGSTYPYWRGYEYWKSGNRSKVTDYAAAGNTTTTYAYPVGTAPHPHAVTGVSSSGPAGTSADTYGYDAAGNMSTRTVSGDTDTFAWDAEGRLQSVTGAAGKTDFVYDAEGERLIKHDPTGATLYLGQTEIRLDKAADSVSSTRYYQFNGATVAMRTSSTQVTSLIADPQGTATVSVDVQTDQLVRRWIDPFGVPRGEDANWKSDARGFVDGKLDDSTGLTHLGAREYDPKLGKFISVDPLVDITDPQTLNAYAYSNSNPATFSDPDGTMFLGSKGDEGTESRGTTSVVEQKQTQKKKTGSYWLPYKGYSGKEITNEAEADIESKITAHSETVRVAKERIKRVIKDLVKIVADELGITDALNCFTNGDIGSCVATGVTILASFAGGIAGKILAKYGSPWKWKKGIELVGNLKNLAGKAITAIKDLLKAGKCNSFVPGTKVLLADGTSKPIEQVKVGDKVKATDPATGKTKAEPVVATIIGQGAKHLVNVAVTSGKPGGATTTANLVATDGHPFYLASEHRWVVATELTTGDNLQPSTPGVESHVTAITRYDATARVHNLTIGAIHTYYVLAGATPVLVHNCGGPVHLSDEVIDTHVLPNHGAGTPGEGTKFHEDLDPDDFGSLANEAVSGSPVPSRVDSVTGNHAHDHDFGPGRTISEDGSTRMRVWVDPDRNVRTMHPL